MYVICYLLAALLPAAAAAAAAAAKIKNAARSRLHGSHMQSGFVHRSARQEHDVNDPKRYR